MKVLIVGFSHSIHTARWINQITDQGWEIKLFPSYDAGAVSDELKDVDVYHSIYATKYNKNKQINFFGSPVASRKLAYLARRTKGLFSRDYRVKQLEKLICSFNPNIIHSMEFQSGGYLVCNVKKRFKGEFPAWIATNWGSDIYYYGNLESHKKKISEVLESCDYYSCECERDICLAKKHGLKGKVLPVFPNSGGFNLRKIESYKKIPVSSRKIIMVKGYQHFAGRTLVALEAFKMIKDRLRGYKIVVYSVQPRSCVKTAYENFSKMSGVETEILPLNTPHEKMLQLYGQSRMAVGLSVSDAISTMVLESMVTGCFPIQSETSCANEWVKHGETGFIVPAEDPRMIAEAINIALEDDKLVNEAAEKNWKVAQERLDYNLIKQKTIDFYNEVYNFSKKK